MTPSLVGLGSSDVEEVERQLRVCDACRYCEAYCSVFPALERHPERGAGDLIFLANLCHDCEACYQACMYSPPHPFAVNIPGALSGVRTDTYERYAWPRWLAKRVGASLLSPVWLTLCAVAVIAMGLTVGSGWTHLLNVRSGPGSFYHVIPFLLLLIPALAAGVSIVGILAVGTVRFWRDAGGRRSEFFSPAVWAAATREGLAMTNLRGAGDECYVPNRDRPSSARRLLHSAVAWGFLATFISTVLAGLWQDVLHQMPPFPVLSPTVTFGIAGGAGLIVGTTGLLYLKLKTTEPLSAAAMRRMDFAFLFLLDAGAGSGMLTLILRSTPTMGIVLDLHIALLFALYLTAPYGKFAHSVYRFAALALDAAEKRRAVASSVSTPHTQPLPTPAVAATLPRHGR